MDFLNDFFMVWMIDDDSWRERGLIHMLMGNKTNMKFDALLDPEKDGMFLSFPCLKYDFTAHPHLFNCR